MWSDVYDFVFVTTPWWVWWGIGVVSLVIMSWPGRDS